MAITLKVQLVGITKPPVWRRFEIPNESSFYDLHDAIQMSFGWEHCHLWCFHGAKHPRNGWLVQDDDDFMSPDAYPDEKLLSFLVFKKFFYTYDFGDDWLHWATVEQIDDREVEDGYALIAKKGENPDEDMGGVWGFLQRREMGEEAYYKQWED